MRLLWPGCLAGEGSQFQAPKWARLATAAGGPLVASLQCSTRHWIDEESRGGGKQIQGNARHAWACSPPPSPARPFPQTPPRHPMLRSLAASGWAQAALGRGLATAAGPAAHTGLLELRQYTLKPEGIKVLCGCMEPAVRWRQRNKPRTTAAAAAGARPVQPAGCAGSPLYCHCRSL
jgi:hypothetical protein